MKIKFHHLPLKTIRLWALSSKSRACGCWEKKNWWERNSEKNAGNRSRVIALVCFGISLWQRGPLCLSHGLIVATCLILYVVIVATAGDGPFSFLGGCGLVGHCAIFWWVIPHHVSERALTAQAWFLLFSRHGSRLRREVREYLSEFPLNPAFGRSYLRTMDHAGGGMSEQIELQDMLEDSNHEEWIHAGMMLQPTAVYLLYN